MMLDSIDLDADRVLRQKFLSWEVASRDTIDFKKIYVDVCGGDILAGLALSEIVYWHLPDKQGNSKMRVVKEGEEWIACPRYEWWDRTRMTPRQIDTAFKKLIGEKLIFKKFFAFRRAKTTHVRINWKAFYPIWNSLIHQPLENPFEPESVRLERANLGSNKLVTTGLGSNQFVTTGVGLSPNGDSSVTKTDTPITESTTKNTDTENTARVRARKAATPSKPKNENTGSSKKTPSNSEAENEPPNSATPPAPRKHLRVARQILPQVEGTAYYEGGGKIADDMIEFEQACNQIFYAYLDTLKELGRLPDTSVEDLWEKNRSAVVALARNRRSGTQVEGFVRYAYSDTYPDRFYQKLPAPITFAAISNAIGGWLTMEAERAAAKKRQQENQKLPTIEVHVWTKEELDRVRREAQGKSDA